MSTVTKLKRSVELSRDEKKVLLDTLKKYGGNKTEAAISLGISKDVFDRTMAFGSCSEKTYNKLFSKAAA